MRLEQRGSAELGRNSNEAVLRVGQNTSSYETGGVVSNVSEGNCDALNDEVILRMIVFIFLFAELSLVVLCQFYLQLCINNLTKEVGIIGGS